MAHVSGNPEWQDYPSLATLITANALENIENALDNSDAGTVLAEVQAVRDDSAALVNDYGNLVTLAQQAQAAAYEVPDVAMRDIINNPATETFTALSSGANLTRFIARAASGHDVTVTAIGDSILEGTTVTADGGTLGVDDALSRVAAALEAAHGITVTPTNRAKSGHTVAMGPLHLAWHSAVADEADLYLVDYGTNDLSADLTTAPVPGYPMPASLAGLERLFRRLRTDVPKADIAYLAANPYKGGETGGNNPAKVAYYKAARDVCAAYGVEFIDGFTPFIELGDYDPLMADTTHPNSAGHALLADTIMGHLPTRFHGSSAALSAVPALGVYDPQHVDPTFGDTGAMALLAPTTGMWEESGTWAADGAARSTSTLGSSIGGTARFTELYVQVDTQAALGARATLTVDGQPVFTDADLTTGKQGVYWIPVATGLTPDLHTYELTATGGTLKVSRVGWLTAAQTSAAPQYNTDIAWQDLGSGTDLQQIPDDGSVLYLTTDRVELPSGWNTARVEFRGYMNCRIIAPTTTNRRVTCSLRLNGNIVHALDTTILPIGDESIYGPSFNVSSRSSLMEATSRPFSMEARMLGTGDKGNTYVWNWGLEAKLTRLT